MGVEQDMKCLGVSRPPSIVSIKLTLLMQRYTRGLGYPPKYLIAETILLYNNNILSPGKGRKELSYLWSAAIEPLIINISINIGCWALIIRVFLNVRVVI